MSRRALFLATAASLRPAEDFATYPAGVYGTPPLALPRWRQGLASMAISTVTDYPTNLLALTQHHVFGGNPARYQVAKTGGKYVRVRLPWYNGISDVDRRFIICPNSTLGVADGYIMFFYGQTSIVAAGSREAANGSITAVPEFTAQNYGPLALAVGEDSFAEMYIPRPLTPASVIEWRVWPVSQPRPAAPGFSLTHGNRAAATGMADFEPADNGQLALRCVNGATCYLRGLQLLSTP